MHDQKWGEDSDKPLIPMTKYRSKPNKMNYLSLANHTTMVVSFIVIHRAGNETILGAIVKTQSPQW
jgi:hypothetical protein